MKKYLILVLCLAMGIVSAKSQITIGASIPPAEGALLDLKEESDGTSQKGLALPRVALEVPRLLYPMLKNDSDYVGDVLTTRDDENSNHRGLVVFNTIDNAYFCKGIYVWEGKEWESLVPCAAHSIVILGCPETTIAPTETVQLTAKVQPEGVSQEVTWTSSDPSVATVSATGLVTAIAEGDAVITVTSAKGLFTAVCNIEVCVPPQMYHHPTIGGSLVVGYTLTLQAAATGTKVKYQWFRNDEKIDGATSHTYTKTTDINDVGFNKYYCLAITNCGTDKSNDVEVEVIKCGTGAVAGTFTVGDNSYLNHMYGDDCWMVSNSKEGDPSIKAFKRKAEGERGYYYNPSESYYMGCPSGWHLPSREEFAVLKAVVTADEAGVGRWWCGSGLTAIESIAYAGYYEAERGMIAEKWVGWADYNGGVPSGDGMWYMQGGEYFWGSIMGIRGYFYPPTVIHASVRCVKTKY